MLHQYFSVSDRRVYMERGRSYRGGQEEANEDARNVRATPRRSRVGAIPTRADRVDVARGGAGIARPQR